MLICTDGRYFDSSYRFTSLEDFVVQAFLATGGDMPQLTEVAPGTWVDSNGEVILVTLC